MKRIGCLAMAVLMINWGLAYGATQYDAIAYTAVSWAQKDGLGAPIWAIAQDRDGYLWLGTDAGLFRFDGVRFVMWEPPIGPALPSSEIRGLFATRDGSLWISFDGAALVSRLREGVVTTYGARDGLPDGSVLALTGDRDGTIWAGGHGGLSYFDGSKWNYVPLVEAGPAPTVETIFEDRSRSIWVGTADGIFRRSPGTRTFQRAAGLSRVALAFSEDTSGLLVNDLQHGANRIVDGTALPLRGREQLLLPGYRLLVDHLGNRWIGTFGKGLAVLPPEDGEPADHRFTIDDGLAGNVVQSLYEDVEGNIWAGTTNGLTRLSRSRIASIQPPAGPSELIRAVEVADATSNWIATSSHLMRYTLTDHRYQAIPVAAYVNGLHTDRSGNLWVATASGLFRYTDDRLVHVNVPSGEPLNRITSLTTTRDGRAWVCDYDKGLFQWDGGAVSRVSVGRDLRDKACTCTYATSNDDVWVGFATGQIFVRRADASTRVYSTSDGLPSGRITSVYQDRHGIIWVATTNGLSRFGEDRRFTTWTTRDGLPSKSIQGVVDDEQGFLWLTVPKGLIRLAPSELRAAPTDRLQTMRYDLYDGSDGLSGYPVSTGRPSTVRAGDGTLWFVTSNGMAVVDPHTIGVGAPETRTRIERFIVNDQDRSPRDGALNPNVRKIEFQYTAFDFAAPEKLRFRYFLEGFDRNWVNGDYSRRVVYANLRPGSYKFHVEAFVGSSPTSREAVTTFSIAPTLYQRAWFWYLCVALSALAAWALWRASIRNIRRQFSVVLTERSRMGREIHDTLLQSLVGVALQLDNLSAVLTQAPDNVRLELARLSRQVGHYIDEARQSIWDLRSPVHQHQFLRSAVTEASAPFAGEGVRIDVRVPDDLRFPAAVQQQLVRITQEAISNAVRHGHASHIWIQADCETPVVTLCISDNGRGFDVTEATGSAERHWGIAIMQERAEQAGGRFAISSAPGNGTRVEVVLPEPIAGA